MEKPKDIEALFDRLGVPDARYVEIRREDAASAFEQRWPLLATVRERAAQPPEVDRTPLPVSAPPPSPFRHPAPPPPASAAPTEPEPDFEVSPAPPPWCQPTSVVIPPRREGLGGILATPIPAAPAPAPPHAPATQAAPSPFGPPAEPAPQAPAPPAPPPAVVASPAQPASPRIADVLARLAAPREEPAPRRSSLFERLLQR